MSSKKRVGAFYHQYLRRQNRPNTLPWSSFLFAGDTLPESPEMQTTVKRKKRNGIALSEV
jgi:hypothetical protein